MSEALRFLPVPRSVEHLGGTLCLTSGQAAETTLDPHSGLPPQGYELVITDGVRLRARDANGMRYGAMTLEQIRKQCGAELPTLRIRDWPDFPVRGYMLDISRDRIPTQPALLELVDTLATLRINQLQLYSEHTFAFESHDVVWRDASPMTHAEIRELDSRCATRGIELVPNQNSFGHMQRWLQHPEYRHFAEVQDGDTQPSCLAPTSESLAFMRSLYEELLPCFRSRTINIGCDETFELGRGRSRGDCEARGRGRVYLDFVLRLIAGLHAQDRSVQFWGDIIRRHPELVSELPRDGLIALVWGYEAPQAPDQLSQQVRDDLGRFDVQLESLRGFEWLVRPFAAAKIPFYVCPGTSSWNTLIGRLPNARANLLDAARTGVANSAAGYLITDWGDNGHLQPPSISLPPLAYGAAVSWCADTNAELALEPELSAFLTGDPSGTVARSLIRLGGIHTGLGLSAMNASPLAMALLAPLNRPLAVWGRTDGEKLASVIQALDEECEQLAHRGDLLHRELRQAAFLARHGAWRLGHIALGQGPPKEMLREDLSSLIEEQGRVWIARSRLGGLSDSLARLERALEDYRALGLR
jgi:hypothetical protein